MLKSLYHLFSSLKLTVVLLCFSMVLIFLGTIEQVRYGIYLVQKTYFHSFAVFYPLPGTEIKVPIFPGGLTLGGLLLINLVVAHFRYFKASWKKAGIMMVHGGLILLLLGELFSALFQVESFMRIPEGETRGYSEDFREVELAVIDRNGLETNTVTSIPAPLLKPGKRIQHPTLPFVIEVEDYLYNTRFHRRTGAHSGQMEQQATRGIGAGLLAEEVPETHKTNERNLATAIVSISGSGVDYGRWMFSNGFEEEQQLTLGDGRTFVLALRQQRYYEPFTLTLLDFIHERYPGTQIPKHFESLLLLNNPETGESREIEVFMNNPLRYAGKTYYQAGFETGDATSILQVVRNPTWLLPYISCLLITAGLCFQFGFHLFKYLRKRTKGGTPA